MKKRDAMAISESIAKEPIWTAVKDGPSREMPTDDGERLSLWQRLQLALGVRTIDMAIHPQTPPSIPLNVTTIGTWVVIIVAILGGFWWSYQLGQTNGRQQQTIEQLNERLTKAEQDAAESKKFQIYAAAGADEQNGHKPNPKKEGK
jgi:hypothetical protein